MFYILNRNVCRVSTVTTAELAFLFPFFFKCTSVDQCVALDVLSAFVISLQSDDALRRRECAQRAQVWSLQRVVLSDKLLMRITMFVNTLYQRLFLTFTVDDEFNNHDERRRMMDVFFILVYLYCLKIKLFQYWFQLEIKKSDKHFLKI